MQLTATQDSVPTKIADLESRIQKQHRIIEGFQNLRSATPNQDVIKQADSNIRDAQRTIHFLQDSLMSLQRRASIDAINTERKPSLSGTIPATPTTSAHLDSLNDPTMSPSQVVDEYAQTTFDAPSFAPFPIDSSAAYRSGSYSMDHGISPLNDMNLLSREPTAARRNYSPLDLMRYDTPLTSAKVQRMLNQLEYKLQLERQFKQGYDKIARLYEAEGDRRSQDDAASRRSESAGKLVLIQQALNRYQQLDMRDAEEVQQENPYAARRARKPQSGTLSISIKRAKEIDHAAISNSTRLMRESYVAIKVEETERVQTPSSRTDTWNVKYELPLENTNEVELVIFDQVGSSVPVPVGLLWLRISDIIEQLRRIKTGQVLPDNAQSSPAAGGGEWVTAERMASLHSSNTMNQTVMQQAKETGMEGWFTVEPTGAIYLRLDFTKQNVTKRPYDTGLGRHGAMRKRPEEVSVVNGHKFVPRQFYQVIRCALCGELLLNAAGSQCQDCNYTCHKKCAQKVVTKCISKTSDLSARDEVELKHRIPHRFEPFTNLGTNWCCHCGSMLPLGRRVGRKCSECDITCHADCMHLVPDFCGMSMEMANQMLSNIATIKKNRFSSSLPDSAAPKRSSVLSTDTLRPSAQQASMGQLTPGMQQLMVTPSSSRPSVSMQGSTQHSPARSPLPSPQQSPKPSPVHPIRQHPASMRQPSIDLNGVALTSPPSSLQPMSQPFKDSARIPPKSVNRVPVPTPSPSHASPLPPRPSLPQVAVVPPQLPSGPEQASSLEFPPSSMRNVTLDDFNFLAVLGKGNFGKVMLAEEKQTGVLYAIKVLKKEFIIENDEIDSTRSEKRVFLTVARERHPFLLNLHSCFQTETRVYFVMEYVGGGDLMLHIQRQQFNLHRAKFYAAEVLLALEYFHKHGIIYRDLKLDNIMLTLDGHVKIADYGLCKENMWYGNTTSTFCGTPEFMAPEILLEQRYGRAVDWWAFGILLYEMLLGQAPFRGDDEDEIFDAILEDDPLYPIQMPRDSVSLLQRLLTRDPSRRLGAGPNDADDVKAHPFFRDVNWDDLINKRVPPPFCPTLRHASDTEWFDTEVCAMSVF